MAGSEERRVLREVALLTNPTAGKGRGARARAEAMAVLSRAGVTVRDLVGRDRMEAESLARAAVAGGVDALVVVGGDGMVHLGAQVVAGTATPLGVVPAGTGNDVARYVDLSRTDAAAATRRLLTGEVREIDLAVSEGRYYATVLCAGFDAAVNERANHMTWPRGQMRYNLATLAELRTFSPLDYVLDLDGTELRVTALMVSVGNGPSFGGGLRITEGAELDDGLLDVVIIKPLSRLELVRTYPKLFSGTHTTHPQYEHHRVRQVRIEASGVVSYADGERFGPLPLTVEAAPRALRLLC
ncbi:diacylglycerol/lipid kinase family protein [Nocardioides acrostichi]|uniref:YegS/Rv2252/BmrU family lipid kinase n=1 Tax=Nocardioides acrostichi TaxID=2784339 RepID=A0A930V390_9ACTN|nr:YegS/Rv2252/BmrU family lipid kinase [Nocardioides acrostichi]MBF4163066.1 YegS/Rv2252/BmrU family lipid kinase [Nocardioides acrostichi]